MSSFIAFRHRIAVTLVLSLVRWFCLSAAQVGAPTPLVID